MHEAKRQKAGDARHGRALESVRAAVTIAGGRNLSLHHPPFERRRLLVVEDDPATADLLRANLASEGFIVTMPGAGPGLWRTLEGHACDLVVLGLTRPGAQGLDICRRVRARTQYTPIIIVNAQSSEAHRILGLELGADDYLTQPFSFSELAARIRALLRRIDSIKRAFAPEPELLRVSDISILVAAREVCVDGQTVRLTPREYDLLYFFARHPNKVFTRAELLNHVWRYGHDGYEHTVNSHINRLRAKIEPDPFKPSRIVTIWGVGYKFRDVDKAVDGEWTFQ